MTNDELKEYYADLLIVQYAGGARARATIKHLAGMTIMDQLPIAVMNAYGIDSAIGAQLDILGKYVGVGRTNYTGTKFVTLNDDDYRQLMKLVLIRNSAGSSLADIQNLLAANFPNLIRISDNQTMSLSYVIGENLGSQDLLDILTTGRFLLAPMAVATSVVVVPDLNTAYFGFRTYSDAGDNISPFNFYAFYNLNYTWLSYNTDLNSDYMTDQQGNAIVQQDGGEILI